MRKFLRLIRRLLNPKKVAVPTSIEVSTPELPAVEPRSTASLAYLSPTRVLIPVVQSALVVVFYLTETGEQLAKPLILSGYLNQAFKVDFPEFNNYYLTTITNYHSYFVYPRTSIQLTYAQQVAAPVIVFHFNQEHQLLHHEYLVGTLGATYQTHHLRLKQYRAVRATSNRQGRFSGKTQIVNYFYQTSAIVWSTRYLDSYVNLRAQVQAFRFPGQSPLRYSLPKQSIWRIFRKVKILDGSLWYDLGGQWISVAHAQRLKQSPFIRQQPRQLTPPLFRQTAIIPGTRRAAISFASGQAVTTWSKPYGDPLHRLRHGEIVNIIKGTILNNNSVWYELEDASWLEEHYLHLLPPINLFNQPIQRLQLSEQA
ncbi:MucBP domain-containing protein [Loigolactobacillus iwatensis]|uniref:MucBP domain-containing protein n=1 Tax=Loigolactobacillus iwatensis TaxID=1267156 RepID=UPI000F7EE8C4|nr:MucBP domain-containing protein [Loigolactobacillus iwatensis]